MIKNSMTICFPIIDFWFKSTVEDPMHVITPTRTLIPTPCKMIAKCVAAYQPTFVSKVSVLLIYSNVSLVTCVVFDQVLKNSFTTFPAI